MPSRLRHSFGQSSATALALVGGENPAVGGHYPLSSSGKRHSSWARNQIHYGMGFLSSPLYAPADHAAAHGDYLAGLLALVWVRAPTLPSIAHLGVLLHGAGVLPP